MALNKSPPPWFSISFPNGYNERIKWVEPSVQFSHSVVSDSLRPHGLQHARPPCPSPTPRAYSNSRPSHQWGHPTISSSSSLSPPACNLSQHPGLFKWEFFASGGQSIGASASASVLPMNIQDRFPLGWTSCISLLSKGLSRVLSTQLKQQQ